MHKKSTSWEEVEKWYDDIVGKEGHYYHQHVVLPGALKLLDLKATKTPSLIDLGCGQGILARALPKDLPYLGVDLSSALIKKAKEHATQKHHRFEVGDLCDPLPIKDKRFTHATLLLVLQNTEFPDRVLKHAAEALESKGTLVLVLNHPNYRIPRQSSWGVDEAKKLQYRRVDLYLSPLKIPIQAHPGQKESSASTTSFHYPLSAYSRFLADAGFSISLIEEWTSNKQSTGKNAKMENRARAEFPLFLAIKAEKK